MDANVLKGKIPFIFKQGLTKTICSVSCCIICVSSTACSLGKQWGKAVQVQAGKERRKRKIKYCTGYRILPFTVAVLTVNPWALFDASLVLAGNTEGQMQMALR